jgi:hypothetical protein
VRNTPWMKWFNSFGFITIVVFSFAFLTTMEFSAFEGKGERARAYTRVQPGGGQSFNRFTTITASQYGESSDSVYAVRGYRSHEHTYYP